MHNHHPNQTHDFSYKLDRTWKTSLQRQIREAMMIDETPDHQLMNSKSEFGANSVPRVVIEDDKPTSSSSSIKRFQSDNPDPGMSSNKRRKTHRSDTEFVQPKVLSKMSDKTTTFSQLISKFCIKSDSKRKNMTARNLPPDLECPELVVSRNPAPEIASSSVPKS